MEPLKHCRMCPVECGADRTAGVGACGASGLKIAKYYLHPFEEPCISFKKGSGTIFSAAAICGAFSVRITRFRARSGAWT
ncbi:MAG: hypothetical protein ACLR06_05625 [Christensenellaceae bacterium]